MKGGEPKAFVFENLVPGTYYKVHCNLYIPQLVSCGFRTLRPDWRIRQNHSRIAVVSQNSALYKAKQEQSRTVYTEPWNVNDAWRPLYQLATRGFIDMIIHVGGAVNLNDTSWGVKESPVSRALEVAYGNDPDAINIICEIFRDVYRRSWSHSFVRHTFANCSNVIARVREVVNDE